MFIDARDFPEGKLIQADLCVVGAGAAGITIAREFNNTAVNVCLLESGDLGPEQGTQDLYKGENVGLDYWPLEAGRLRYFGGTTNHWGGACRPLDESDFEPRPWVDHSGWPFAKATLLPYYRRAQPIPELGPFGYSGSQWESAQAPGLAFRQGPVLTEMVQHSPPTRFGTTYREELQKSANVRVYLNANVINVETPDNAGEVSGLEVARLDGTRLRAAARYYVLALGGIENARLLLLSDTVQAAGLGNQHDLVGRYFADHPYLSNLGFMVLSDPKFSPVLYSKEHSIDGHYASGYLTATEEVRREQKLLATRVHLRPTTWKKYRRIARRKEDFTGRMLRMFRELTGIDADDEDEDGTTLLRFGAWTEPVPRRNSRVYLGDERDALGQRRVVLDWRTGEQEKDSLMRTIAIIAAELGRAGLGRMRIDIDGHSPWPWQGGGTPGLHHMGTTRMHTDPKQGVVDADCRVHGVANLFVAGSSVFPNYGAANPTFTILALALRLGDHLKGLMK